jgi:hypothetical protein
MYEVKFHGGARSLEAHYSDFAGLCYTSQQYKHAERNTRL